MRRMRGEQGQSTLEFAIMVGVIVVAFVALSAYIKFAAAGRLKSSADSISQTLFNPASGLSDLTVNRVTVDKSFTDGRTESVTQGTDTTTRVDKL